MMRRYSILFVSCLTGLALLLVAAGPANAATTAVAVFNFQMKSETPDWRWLEKGLADRLVTDFFSNRALVVLDRDQMEQIAERMHWAPEMQGDARHVPQLSQFQARYLISGVYELSGDKVTMTAIVVDFASRKEVARREVSGPAAEALQLERQLSAQVLAWLTKGEPEKILADLPAWTRSLPAAKALYDGVNLYDQGRYAEAWLLFRQASEKDTGYVEARYWVGKMYYFMNRYDHARIELERFLYNNSRHPRLGDAIKEYAHIYEETASTDDVLALYRRLRDRFCVWTDSLEALAYETKITEAGTDNLILSEWLAGRIGQLLDQAGRHREAMQTVRGIYGSGQWNPAGSIIKQHILTGEVFSLKDLDAKWRWPHGGAVVFRGNQTEAVLELPSGVDNFAGGFRRCPVQAPAGYVFKELRVFPIIKDTTGDFFLFIGLDDRSDVAVRRVPIAQAAKEGVLVADLPRTGLLALEARCTVEPDPLHWLRGLRVVATFEKTGPCGALEVSCADGNCFRVNVDGRLGRMGAGLIGLLPPGKHVLTFLPNRPGTPFASWQTEVEVQEGRTISVAGRLGRRDQPPWNTLAPAIQVGGNYPGFFNAAYADADSQPAIQCDDQAIRLVWAYGSNLWSSVSTDGLHFSPTRRLELPVSTAWLQARPCLTRLEDGRFVLVFMSDRGLNHQLQSYVCWSRDFEHWSAPAAFTHGDLWGSDLISDGHGRLLYVLPARGNKPNQYEVWISDGDLFQWRSAATVTLPQNSTPWCCRILKREDGILELYLLAWYCRSTPNFSRLYRCTSNDGVSWSVPEQLLETQAFSLSVARAGARTVVALGLGDTNWAGIKGACRFLCSADDGTWKASENIASLADGYPTLTWHPRWHGLICSMAYHTRPKLGPFVTACGDLTALGKAPDMMQDDCLPCDANSIKAEAAAPELSWASVRGSYTPPHLTAAGPHNIGIANGPRRAGSQEENPAAPRRLSPQEEFFQALDERDSAKVAAMLQSHPEWAKALNRQSESALMDAAGRGYHEIVQALLTAGADPNFAGAGQSESPLGRAAKFGYSRVVAELLKAGANVAFVDSDGFTAILHAASAFDLDTVQILLEHKAEVKAANFRKRTALHLVCGNGPFPETTLVARLLLDNGADTKAVDDQGQTPLHWAVVANNTAAAKLLLERGADPNAVDQHQSTPILLVERNSAKAMIEILLAHGANLNVRDDNGWTPLHYAASADDPDAVALLLAKGVEVDSRDHYGRTPLMKAAHESDQVVAVLLAAGADPNLTDNDGWTAVHHAAHTWHSGSEAATGHETSLEVLLKHGGQVNVKAHDGATPLSLCNNNKININLLKQAGAKE